MSLPDLAEALRLVAAPALLAMILLAHVVYYRRHRTSDGQQVIRLVALADEPAMIAADGSRFDPQARKIIPAILPPRPRFLGLDRRKRRSAAPHRVADTVVPGVLICADDLVCDGDSRFLGAVKVGGDLIVNGNAIFAAPVIVNGVLKIIGSAQFTDGILAKGDTFVAGAIAIGSADRAGWAALGQVALGERLDLHGQIVASNAVQLRKVA